jgi:hypothetical protein
VTDGRDYLRSIDPALLEHAVAGELTAPRRRQSTKSRARSGTARLGRPPTKSPKPHGRKKAGTQTRSKRSRAERARRSPKAGHARHTPRSRR